MISDKISAGSNMIVNDRNYYWGCNAVYKNYWSIRNDSLILIPDGNKVESHLMFRKRLSLRYFDTKEVRIIGWTTTVPYTELDKEYYVLDYTLFGKFYDQLNIFINNNLCSRMEKGILLFTV